MSEIMAGSTIPTGSVTFPYQLWHMLTMYPDDPDPILRWSPDGLGVIINEYRFREEAKDVYPGILTNNSIGNFKSRLNKYGFKCRRRTHNDVSEVWHQFFQRNMEPRMLKLVVYNEKKNSSHAWNEEDISEVEDHMEDTNSSEADLTTSSTSNHNKSKPETADTSPTHQENDVAPLPVLQQVQFYEPQKTQSDHQSPGSSRHHTPNVILNGAALRTCFSANDTNTKDATIPLSVLVHPPKAEADSSDDPIWRPPKGAMKKSSGDDADTEEDDAKETKQSRKRTISPKRTTRKSARMSPTKSQRKSQRKKATTEPQKANASSPYKASIDSYYKSSRLKGWNVRNVDPWIEEDRKRQEILEKQQKKGCASTSITPPPKESTSYAVPDHCPFPLMSPSHHQVHMAPHPPCQMHTHTATAPQIVLLPFMVTSQGYEPLLMPGGGIQAYPSSMAHLQAYSPLPPRVPYYGSPWASSSCSDIPRTYPSPPSQPCGSGKSPRRGKARGGARASYQAGQGTSRQRSRSPATPKSSRKKASHRRSLYKTSDLETIDLTTSPMVKSNSNSSLATKEDMMTVVSRVTNPKKS